jgi:hypothetical protein
MKLKELREAVERHTECDYLHEGRVVMFNFSRRKMNDTCLIADCLTDPTPISKEVLEGMGFEDHGLFAHGLQLNVGGSRVSYFQFRDEWVFAVNTTTMDPQPRTVGELYFLLLRLGEQQ